MLKRIILGIALGLALLGPGEASAQSVPAKTQWIDVELGQTAVQRSNRTIQRVIVTDPEVVEIQAYDQTQFGIQGRKVGTTDLWLWYKDDMEHPEVFEITVHRDLAELTRRTADLCGTSVPPRIYPVGERIVIQGDVPDLSTLEQIALVAKVYDKDFVNLMTVRGDHQVQLEVTFAEVSRSAMRELGLNFLWANDYASGGLFSPGSTGDQGTTYNPGIIQDVETGAQIQPNGVLTNTGAVPSVGTGSFALFGTLLWGANTNALAAVLSALETHSISKTIAQPKLLAMSGQESETLVGGRIPVPAGNNNGMITVDFQEYGVKLVFLPTVLGDGVIDMQVYVEVSEIDASSGTRVAGIEIPGFSVRKTKTHLRVADGMTFAISGMVGEQVRYTRAELPILGEIPILGTAFSYTQHVRDEQEVIVFVTPKLVRPLAADEVPAYPGTTENNNPNDFELFLLGMDHASGSQTAAPTGPVGMER